MRRVRNWDVRLVRALSPLRGAPLVWGETDCVSLCLVGLRAMYEPGDLPLPDDLPTWTTQTGAFRVLRREPAFHEVLLEHGCRTVDLRFAQSGDVVHRLPSADEFPGYGIVTERGVLHVDIARGMVVWDRLRAVRTSETDALAVRPPHD